MKGALSSGYSIVVSFISQKASSPRARQWKVAMAPIGVVMFSGLFIIAASVQAENVKMELSTARNNIVLLPWLQTG